jgi:hypothetical protein
MLNSGSAMPARSLLSNTYIGAHSLAPARVETQDYWSFLAENSVLLLGSSRSGTTWLAKIFDSHPKVLYRHEPDEAAGLDPGLQPIDQIAAWLRQRRLRVAAKRPYFPKDWRPHPLRAGRTGITAALAAARRLPVSRDIAARMPIPDFVLPQRRRTVRAALKLVNWSGLAAAQTMAGVRCVFIVRHPCARIASVMAGGAARRFADYHGPNRSAGGSIHDPDAVRRAEAAGIDAKTFARLPEAAQLAWGWLAFNEPAVVGFQALANARIIRYEDLCNDPRAVSQSLFAFAELPWHKQTEAFVAESTSADRGAGYFDVFRAGAEVADKWRQTMSVEDQRAIHAVVSGSPLATLWPDLS